MIAWRQKGPLGKLHNILEYIRKTPQREDSFALFVRRSYPDETVFTIKVGNITRWSGDYESILRAFRLREAIEEFIREAIRLSKSGERGASVAALIHDELLPEDWDMQRCIVEILGPFKEWCSRLQVCHCNGCIADILPAMDDLFNVLEDAKLRYRAAPELIPIINNAWMVMDK